MPRSIVYILQAKGGYEARLRNSEPEYQFDLEMAGRMNERLICAFDVPTPLVGKAFALTADFAEKHNSGENPNLKDLEQKVKHLIQMQ